MREAGVFIGGQNLWAESRKMIGLENVFPVIFSY